MAKVNSKKHESFDKLLRRFKRQCESDKIIIEARCREFFETKSEKKRKQKKAAIKRQEKQNLKNQIKKKLY